VNVIAHLGIIVVSGTWVVLESVLCARHPRTSTLLTVRRACAFTVLSFSTFAFLVPYAGIPTQYPWLIMGGGFGILGGTSALFAVAIHFVIKVSSRPADRRGASS
jgi:hypothetical protein